MIRFAEAFLWMSEIKAGRRSVSSLVKETPDLNDLDRIIENPMTEARIFAKSLSGDASRVRMTSWFKALDQQILNVSLRIFYLELLMALFAMGEEELARQCLVNCENKNWQISNWVEGSLEQYYYIIKAIYLRQDKDYIKSLSFKNKVDHQLWHLGVELNLYELEKILL